MKLADFVESSQRTDVDDYSAPMSRIAENKKVLYETVFLFMLSSGGLDLMKKRIMYNATPDKMLKADAEHADVQKFMRENGEQMFEIISKDETLSRLFHYVIGVITEANEQMEALLKATMGQLDIVNVSEEIGDSMFYQARIVKTLNQDFNQILQRNVDKLKARYPDKFTEDNALDRDLETERQILEGN